MLTPLAVLLGGTRCRARCGLDNNRDSLRGYWDEGLSTPSKEDMTLTTEIVKKKKKVRKNPKPSHSKTLQNQKQKKKEKKGKK